MSPSNSGDRVPNIKQSSSTVAQTSDKARATRRLWSVWGPAALGTFVLTIFAAGIQWLSPVPYPPPGWTSIWKYLLPLEFHAEQKLPDFENGNIRTVEVVPNSNRVWIAGDQGLLAYSDDGFSWAMYDWDGVAGVPKKRVATAQTPTSAASASRFPSVLAASLPQAQQSNPPPRVQSQTNARGQQQQQQNQQQQQQQPSATGQPLELRQIAVRKEITRSSRSPIPGTAVHISWVTNLPASSEVEYGDSIKYREKDSDPSLTYDHEVLLTNVRTVLHPSGQYHFRVISIDSNGQRAVSADQTFTIPEPGSQTQFGISIDSPSANATVSGEMTLTARISGPGLAQSLRFTLDGKDVGAATTAKLYTYLLDTRKFPDGPHVLAAIGRDATGNSVTSPDITINISNGVPRPDFRVVLFEDGQNGRLMAGNLDQFSTKDGGATWQRMPNRFTNSETLKGARVTHGLHPYSEINDASTAPAPRGIWLSRRFKLQFTNSANTLVVSSTGWLTRSSDWNTAVPTVATDNMRATYGAWGDGKNQAWICGTSPRGIQTGVIFKTADQGYSWTQELSFSDASFFDLTFQEDGRHGWAVGTSGVILLTRDGGATWYPQTRAAAGLPSLLPGTQAAAERYWKFPAPWTVPAALLFLFLVYRAVKQPGAPPLPASIATNAVRDSPLEPGESDVLGLGRITHALSGFLRNEGTQPPITIAVNGEWGTGKSSLMNLLRKDLEKRRFCPVWFNAWHNQEEPSLMAAMLQTVKMEAVPPLFRGGIPFRARLFWGRIARDPVRSVLLLSVFAFLLATHVKLKMDGRPGLLYRAAEKIDETFPSQELMDASRRRVEVLNYLLDTIPSLFERTGQSSEISKRVAEALPKIGETAKGLASDVKLGNAEDKRQELNAALDGVTKKLNSIQSRKELIQSRKELLDAALQVKTFLPFATEAPVNASPQQYSRGGVEAIYQGVKELADSLQPAEKPAEPAPPGGAPTSMVKGAAGETAKMAREQKAADAAQKLIVMLPQGVQSQPLQLAGAGPKHDVFLTLGALVKLLALAGGLISGVLPLWRSLRAFGENPASLLTTAAPGKSLSALNQQTSFRKKFAQEFQDVNEALGSRRMAIFIDDLDRCRPDKVSELLEAVNYVTNSGHCLVIMALERKTVEASVGLAFQGIAEERNYADPDGAAPDPSFGDGILGESRRRRAAFAKQYLDKLINIEVDVPKLSTDRAADVSRREEPVPVPRWRKWGRRIWAMRWAAVGVGAAVVLTIAGYYAGVALAPPEPTTPAQLAGPPISGGTGTTAGTKGPADQVNKGVKNPDNGAQNTAQGPPPIYQEGGRAHPETQSAGLWAMMLLAAGALGVVIRTILYARREDLRAVEKDSEPFQAALKIWLPVVEARQPTPRSVKRFLNRVRFLACLQQPGPYGEGPAPIPESILIALAALYKIEPQMVFDEKQFEKANDSMRSAPLVKPIGKAFEMAWRQHEETFHNLGEMAGYRTRFLELLPGFTQH